MLYLPKEQKMRYLVFVDFDGVLTSNRVHMSHPQDSYYMWATFDPVVMEFFNKLHFTHPDLYFVWTTTWRNNVEESMMTEHWAYSMWYNAGFRGFFGKPWRVNPEHTFNPSERAKEVLHYLETYASECEDYVIIDDSDYGFNKVLPKKRFVKTDSDNGMLFKHMKDILSLTGNWAKR